MVLVSSVSNNLSIMEEDILNYSPTVMFRGTLCSCIWLDLIIFAVFVVIILF